MNARSFPAEATVTYPATGDPARPASAPGLLSFPASRRTTWLVPLTVVCFVFGGLTAVQLRTIQKVHLAQAANSVGLRDAQSQLDKARKEAEQARAGTAALKFNIKELQAKLAKGSMLTQTQVRQLNNQIRSLQMALGLTKVVGPGVVVRLTDNQQAASQAGGSPFVPGLVHDFDLLQVVNELRAARADAISIMGANGKKTRITAYTPIRCVGPSIMVNFEIATPPLHH